MKTQISRKSGFTLVEIMIVVAIIGLLAAIAIPNFVKARSTAQQNGCINNLRQIDGAKEQWALEKKKKNTDPCEMTDIADYIKGGAPKCPSTGEDNYTVGNIGADPECPNGDDTYLHELPNPTVTATPAP